MKSDRWSRYAPSPTGPLHLGNLQSALASWLQARAARAGFILRIEDLDAARCRPQYIDSIVADLARLGLDWHVGPGAGSPADYLQSARLDLYRDTLDNLARDGRLFPCRCSRRELTELASAPHGPMGPVYPGTCHDRRLADGEGIDAAAESDEALRFRVTRGRDSFVDRIAGEVTCDVEREVGDFVVFRRDGVVAYHLAVVVDDIAMGVTDVVRGADLLPAVFPQAALYRALGVAAPAYWHVPLRRDRTGARLSKRVGGPSLATVLDAGWSIERVIGSLAAGLGLLDNEEPITLEELSARFDESELARHMAAALRRDAAAGYDP